MIQIVSNFCITFDYPAAAAERLCTACDTIYSNRNASALMEENRQLLQQNAFCCQAEELERLNKIAELTEIHPYTVHLVFYIICSQYIQVQYAKRGLPLELWHNAMLDLKWKLFETKQVYGIWGVHCGDWFRPFFTMERFALGRLQFELVPSLIDCENGYHVVKTADSVINVHIPSSGPLVYEEVLDAYSQAACFFGSHFTGPAIPFQCETWLLYPRINRLLRDGNLKRFTADYDVRMAGIDPRQDDRWRVFHVPNSTPIAEYEERTSLQQNLKAWLLEGNVMGIGVGCFFYENGRVLPHDPYLFDGDDTEILQL